MGKMTGAEYIARVLKTNGITHVFYMEAILRKTMIEMEKLGIKRILTHGEKAAAYMADGYARIKHGPGICMAQSVGAANLAAGLQDSYLGHSPVIAFTGRKPPGHQNRRSYQEIDHNHMFGSVTKYNERLDDIRQLPLILRHAFKAVSSGAPGPAHIDLLGYVGDITEKQIGDFHDSQEESYPRIPTFRPVPEKRFLEQTVKAIMEAKTPIIVAGKGVLLSGAKHIFRDFIHKINIPVATSVDGKTILLDDDDRYVGPVGTYSRKCANRAVSEADLVFFIGTTVSDQLTVDWTIPAEGTRVIQLDIEPLEPGRNYPGTICLHGDVKIALESLSKMIPERIVDEQWVNTCRRYVSDWRNSVEDLRNSEEVPITPERLCREISEHMPKDTILVSDTGYSAVWAATQIDFTYDEQTMIRAAGSLGWAFPAALGAKCAAPERPVLCFTGDGAFWYHLQEMETAARWGLNTVTIINNNSVLAQSMPEIHDAYCGGAGNPEELFTYNNTDFARIASDMGCIGVQVTAPDQLGPAIRKAFSSQRPVIIDVKTKNLVQPR